MTAAAAFPPRQGRGAAAQPYGGHGRLSGSPSHDRYKGRDPGEADRLVADLKVQGLLADRQMMIYGHEGLVKRTSALAPAARGFTSRASPPVRVAIF
ncbi:hypothetical protein FHS96_005697 [Sphingomonas zeicaulis]|uniref:hypothetical protein n=1 Tax=Sphingomonas zeicaulis TaxID=1632740 RepID=UPI003D227C85